MLDSWEMRVGLDAGNGADGALDADGDGQTNLQEFRAGTLPTGSFVRYLAEGANNSFFKTFIHIFNPSDTDTALVEVRYLGDSGQMVTDFRTLPPRSMTITMPIATDASFSTIVESNHLVAVERTMSWGDNVQGLGEGYGSSAETAVTTPSTTWYFAEGATHGAFDLFYLLQNPNAAANVTITTCCQTARASKGVSRGRAEPPDDFRRWRGSAARRQLGVRRGHLDERRADRCRAIDVVAESSLV
jgi:hypothetical protein